MIVYAVIFWYFTFICREIAWKIFELEKINPWIFLWPKVRNVIYSSHKICHSLNERNFRFEWALVLVNIFIYHQRMSPGLRFWAVWKIHWHSNFQSIIVVPKINTSSIYTDSVRFLSRQQKVFGLFVSLIRVPGIMLKGKG